MRKFPDWWKPYRWNYYGEGYFICGLALLCIYGYSYTKDIKAMKGRKERKIFDKSYLLTMTERHRASRITSTKIAEGDENFTKFLEIKHSSAHH